MKYTGMDVRNAGFAGSCCWRLNPEDKLEALHMQAWYFRIRHFARLRWTRLDCPDGEYFVTGDRAVAWLADGFAGTLCAEDKLIKLLIRESQNLVD
jgi:hypothetical protein